MSGLSEKEASRRAALLIALGILTWIALVVFIIFFPAAFFFVASFICIAIAVRMLHKSIKRELMFPTNKGNKDV